MHRAGQNLAMVNQGLNDPHFIGGSNAHVGLPFLTL